LSSDLDGSSGYGNGLAMRLAHRFSSYMHENMRGDFLRTAASLPSIYRMELASSKKSVVEDLIRLSENLHPSFFYESSVGRNVRDEMEWLIENKHAFLNPAIGDGIDRRAERAGREYVSYLSRLDSLSSDFSGMLFCNDGGDPFDSQMPYLISGSSLGSMGFKAKSAEGDGGRLTAVADLREIGLGIFNYGFGRSGDDFEGIGKRTVSEEPNNSSCPRTIDVVLGLPPSTFERLSTAVTLPTEASLLHIISNYCDGGLHRAKAKAFNDAFKEFGGKVSLVEDQGALFGHVDEDAGNYLEKRGVELRGRDLLDPFLLLEISKRHGDDIADALEGTNPDFHTAAYEYLADSLPYSLMQDGIACRLSASHAEIGSVPSELSGLEGSVRGIVAFGSDLRRFEILSHGIGFYEGKPFVPHPIPRSQAQTLSYLFVSALEGAGSKDSAGLPTMPIGRWHLDQARDLYRQSGLMKPKPGRMDVANIQNRLNQILEKKVEGTFALQHPANSFPASGPNQNVLTYGLERSGQSEDFQTIRRLNRDLETPGLDAALAEIRSYRGGRNTGSVIEDFLSGPADSGLRDDWTRSLVLNLGGALGRQIEWNSRRPFDKLVFDIVRISLGMILDI
jgi:hypothetical protein